MAKTNSISADEKRWQAESDARALAEAELIKGTPGRLRAAQKQAKAMATMAKKEADSMAKIAKTLRRTPVKSARKTAKRGK